MSMWHDAAGIASAAKRALEAAGDAATLDQKIALAQVYATLSIGQALSGMQSNGLTISRDESLPTRDGHKATVSYVGDKGSVPHAKDDEVPHAKDDGWY